MQTTLVAPVGFRGVGLHSGRLMRLRVNPAPADHGIAFLRTDMREAGLVPARWTFAEPAQLCTRIANRAGASVSTIEHLMAALAGCGIHNALIEIDGPEVPILDGSARPFVEAFLARGLSRQDAPLSALRMLSPVSVQDGDALARLEPAPRLEIDFSIEFENRVIGRQAKALDMANGAFVRELADSRTFCRHEDVERMHAMGMALGGSLRNAVVFDEDRVLSPGGLRHRDEPVRHKMLDALGDLSLAGMPILGRYVGLRAGHALTGRLLRTVFATPSAWEVVTLTQAQAHDLPGAGVGLEDLALSA